MHRRQLSKFIKVVIAIILYSSAYLLISYILTPKPIYNFVSDDLRVGDKYVFIYLFGNAPAFSDEDGADVFASRRCGTCFITNNRGFLPLSEYDAVVVHGDRRLLTEASAFMEPAKRYLMEADQWCLEKKLMGCDGEPKFTSFGTRDDFTVCGLCRHLHDLRARNVMSSP